MSRNVQNYRDLAAKHEALKAELQNEVDSRLWITPWIWLNDDA